MDKIIAVDIAWTVQGMHADMMGRLLNKAIKDGILENKLVAKGFKIKFGAISYLGNGIELAVAYHEGDKEAFARAVSATIGTVAGSIIGGLATSAAVAGFTITEPWTILLVGVGLTGALSLVGQKSGEYIWDSLSDGQKKMLFDWVGFSVSIKTSSDNPPDPEDPPKPEDPPPVFDPREGFGDSRFFLRDPLALDLNGDGVKFVKDGAYFDYDNNGSAEKATWLDKTDGWLVLDRNGYGKIDAMKFVYPPEYQQS